MNADGVLRTAGDYDITPCFHHPKQLTISAIHHSGDDQWYELKSYEGGCIRLLNRYTLLGVIGRGAQGVILCAYDSLIQQKVVIKKMVEPFRNSYTAQHTYREFTLLSSIQHPNIIRLLNVYTTSTSAADFKDLYLVMEHMEMSLQDFIRHPNLEWKHLNISNILFQLLRAMEHLHSAGIVHRDVKPENIVINLCSGEVKLLDFGLARRKPTSAGQNGYANADAGNEEAMMSPYVVTRTYRAPEVLLRSGHQQAYAPICYSEKVDLWSVGVILLELVLHHCPCFFGRDMTEQWRKIVEELGTPDEAFMSRLPESIRNIIAKNPHIFPHFPPVDWRHKLPDSEMPPDESDGLTKQNLRDLLSKMLVIDPAKRITTAEALRHPYLAKYYCIDEGILGRIPQPPPSPSILASLDHDDSVQKSVAEWKALLFHKFIDINKGGTSW